MAANVSFEFECCHLIWEESMLCVSVFAEFCTSCGMGDQTCLRGSGSVRAFLTSLHTSRAVPACTGASIANTVRSRPGMVVWATPASLFKNIFDQSRG